MDSEFILNALEAADLLDDFLEAIANSQFFDAFVESMPAAKGLSGYDELLEGFKNSDAAGTDDTYKPN